MGQVEFQFFNNLYFILQQIDSYAEECQNIFKNIPDLFKILEEKLPSGEYYRYHYQFRMVTQKLVFVSAFLIYLRENR